MTRREIEAVIRAAVARGWRSIYWRSISGRDSVSAAIGVIALEVVATLDDMKLLPEDDK